MQVDNRCRLFLGYLGFLYFIPTSGRYVRNYDASEYSAEKDYLDIAEGRPGSATDTHSCDSIRTLPPELRTSTHMYPQGLTEFYEKYTEAYGIPIVSSRYVSDSALRRTCYTVRFLFADIYAIRNSFYKRYGRFGVIGVHEGTTTIPEHSWLPEWWNTRARGLGATDAHPVSTAGEENALCFSYPTDRYRREDIVLHEFAHGFHLLGAKYAIPGFQDKLKNLYKNAKETGLWKRTYAQTDPREYFAEGVQSYFNAEAYAYPPDGIHNDVNTRDKLRKYDPGLYELIYSLFPCNNRYIMRCDKNRTAEKTQKLRINCDGKGGASDHRDNDHVHRTESNERGSNNGRGEGHASGRDNRDNEIIHTERPNYGSTDQREVRNNGRGENRGTERTANRGNQEERHGQGNGVRSGERADNDRSDGGAKESGSDGDRRTESGRRRSNEDDQGYGRAEKCIDSHHTCPRWAEKGECSRNPGYMRQYCQLSCNLCDNTAKEKTIQGDEIGNCLDEHEYCPQWASNGECKRNPGYMRENCKLSCEVCEHTGGGAEDCNDVMPACDQWAKSGFCKKRRSRDYMRHKCKRSCALC